MLTRYSFVLSSVIVFALATTVHADDFAITTGGKSLTVLDSVVFFFDASLVDKPGLVIGASGLWDMANPRGIQSLSSRGGKFNHYPLKFDGDGKTKDVRVDLSKGRWLIRKSESGTTIEAAEGPLKGMYLGVGTEKVELADKDGKKNAVGWQPVLSDKPSYFIITGVSK